MLVNDFCYCLPYTLSIQFPREVSQKITHFLRENGVENSAGHHLSLKYLGYEKNLSEAQLEKVLERLSANSCRFKKQEIRISGFGVLKNPNSFFSNLLYASVSPYSYLRELHEITCQVLDGLIDIFVIHDFDNFVPHISCGHVSGSPIIDILNERYQRIEPVVIKEWDAVVHTSTKEYLIF